MARIIQSLDSADGVTTKALFELEDLRAAETVRILRSDKSIICFSTMVGCPIGCGFCASGRPGMYRRKLTSDEMFDMIWHMHANHADRPSWIISAMGEGEPALNALAIMNTFSQVNRDFSVPCKFAVSTAGPNMTAMTELLELVCSSSLDIKLQYSLHATDNVRRKLIPYAKLPERDAITLIAQSSPKCEINIVLMKGVNTSTDQLLNMSFILKEIPRSDGQRWKVKLNRYNAIEGLPFQPADPETIEGFQTILRADGHSVEYYETDGQDIAAACGQLHYKHEGQKYEHKS